MRSILAVCLVVLLADALPARAEDWTRCHTESFDKPGWAQGWDLQGSVGPRDAGVLVNAGGEMIAALKKEFKAPAVRVSFDATMAQANAEGQFGDLSCFIGGVFFQLGGEYNTRTRIRHDTTTEDLKGRIRLGKTQRIIAEINGRVARMAIDGKEVGLLLLKEAPTKHTVKLYTWAGTAHFDNLSVYTRTQIDPVPEDLLAQGVYGHQTAQTLKHLRDWPLPKFAPGKTATVKRARVRLTVDYGPHAKPGMRWPATFGVPLPQGVLFDPDQSRIVDARGNEVPSQRTVTATWSGGGAIRWLLIDVILPVAAQTSPLFLEYGADVRAGQLKESVKIDEAADTIAIDSGVARFVVSKRKGTVLESASLDRNGDGAYAADERILGPADSYYTTRKGWHYRTGVADDELDVKVEMAGPIRAVIRSRGWYKDEAGRRACYFTRRLYVYRGLPWAKLFTTWVVTVDTRAYTFTDVATRFSLPNADEAIVGLDAAGKMARVSLAGKGRILALVADRHKGVIAKGNEREDIGDLPGWLTLRGKSGGVTLACYEMARHWPTALEAKRGEIVFHGFSNEAGLDLDMTLGGLKKLWGEKTFARFNASRGAYPAIEDRNPNGLGIAKTHELLIALHATDAPATDTAMPFQKPIVVSADPVHNCETGVVGPGEYHPHDPKNFPKEEAVIETQRDRLLNALDRIEPWYGFWDYGAGVPHHIRGNIDGKGRLTYNGYRRCYDIGYQQTLVPWMMYLRSGQRPWLEFGIRNARCMMDARTHHWTDMTVNKHVGWAVQDHGTWAWDTHLAGWGFNYYAPTLLLDYYTTGDERAMDVFIEVMDEFARTGSTYYSASVGVWLGNVAAAYRATWEPKYLAKYRETERNMLRTRCGLCGGLKGNRDVKDKDHEPHGRMHRDGWNEYGIMEALQVPGHAAELRDILVTDGKRRFENRASTPYATCGYVRLLAYRATQDPRIAREGQLLFNRYTKGGARGFTGFCGPSHARHLPVLMKLALVPGVEKVKLPVKARYNSPLYVQHVNGRETRFTIETAQKLARKDVKVAIAGRDGKPVPEGMLQFDPTLGRLHVTVPAAAPAEVYVLRTKDNNHVSMQHPEGMPLCIDVVEGYRHHSSGKMPVLWFNVPAGVTAFRLRTNLHERKLTVTRPDGKQVGGTGEWHTIPVPAGLPAGAWSVESDAAESHNFQIVKFYGIPALVALSPGALFAMAGPPMPAPDYTPLEFGAPFAPGALPGSKAVHVDGRDQLRIPLGEKTGVRSRKRLNALTGTIEFFFQLNESPYFAKTAGLPLRVSPDRAAPYKGWMRHWLSIEYKNAVLFTFPDARSQRPARFGPWEYRVGMIDLRPGRWYHLAIVWHTRKSFTIGANSKAKSQARVFLDGRNLGTTVYDTQPNWFPDAYDAPLPAEFMEMFSTNHNVLFDELRVSDVERVAWDRSMETYPVPTKPYKPDKHTLLLMHFDGDFSGVGRASDTFTATFRNAP